MAFALMGGLLVATVLTLIFLPAVYVAWFSGFEKWRPAHQALTLQHLALPARGGLEKLDGTADPTGLSHFGIEENALSA